MTFTIIQPADVEAAIDILRRVPLLVDSPTQRRQRDPDGLSRAFAGGDFRRPDLVWAAVEDGGEPRAVVAGLLAGTQTVLDFFGADDEAALTAVVAAATAGVRDQEWPEACLYAPPGAGVDSPQLRPWVRALRDAGWDLLVERHHYDLAPHPGLAAPPADCPLRLEPLAGPDDPRLEPAVRDVLVGSLDVADRTLTARVGLERAAREAVRDLLASDPWQCLRLAYDDGPERRCCWRPAGSWRPELQARRVSCSTSWSASVDPRLNSSWLMTAQNAIGQRPARATPQGHILITSGPSGTP